MVLVGVVELGHGSWCGVGGWGVWWFAREVNIQIGGAVRISLKGGRGEQGRLPGTKKKKACRAITSRLECVLIRARDPGKSPEKKASSSCCEWR